MEAPFFSRGSLCFLFLSFFPGDRGGEHRCWYFVEIRGALKWIVAVRIGEEQAGFGLLKMLTRSFDVALREISIILCIIKALIPLRIFGILMVMVSFKQQPAQLFQLYSV